MNQPSPVEQSWFIASRWQEYAGELRASLLRVVLLLAFYGLQLLNFWWFTKATEADRQFHEQVTYISLAWLLVTLGTLLALKNGFLPPILKYATTTCDLLLLTLIAALGNGPSSPIVLVYFIILVLAALRFRLGLIWFATLGAMTCYWVLVGRADPVWFDNVHTTSPITQLITLLTIGATGMTLGQMVRSTRQMANAFRQRSLDTQSEVTK